MKRFERSNGLDTALYKNYLYLYLTIFFKILWAVEGTTYRGCFKLLFCAKMTLMFEAFLGCASIIPSSFMHDMIPLAYPILFHLKLRWGDEARV